MCSPIAGDGKRKTLDYEQEKGAAIASSMGREVEGDPCLKI